MLTPSVILALVAFAATPLAPAGRSLPTGKAPQGRATAAYEDVSVETPPEYHSFPSEGWDLVAGTADASDIEQGVGFASLQDGTPGQREPLATPPGGAAAAEPSLPTDLEEILPLAEPLPNGESPSDDRLLLDESPWASESTGAGEEGCRSAACGEVLCPQQCAACGGECSCCRRLLQDVGFDGWISQGITINTDNPADRSNFPVTFNDRSNDYQMNQFYLLLGKAVDEGSCHWDLGGRVDLLYGTDSVYTTARGLETRGDLSARWNAQRYGLAMPQAYLEVYAPWGNGLTMKLGHFYTILGYETVPAAENFFYSKSYALQYGEPFTHTGFLGSTRLGPLRLHAGMTRGWDNWEDNNNDFSFLGGLSWTRPDQGTAVALAVHVGREQDEPPLNTNVRTVYSFVVQQWLSERLLYAFQYDYGFDEGGGPRGQDADWYGVNQYLYYTIDCCWRAGLRCEWFCDEDGARIDGNTGADYFELSLGLNWTPTDWITVRPELRWDWADALRGGSLDPAHRDDQILMALDVIARL